VSATPLSPPAGAAVFDFDGVIVDSRTAVRTAINGALVAHGLAPRAAAELDRFIGPPAPSAFAELTGDAPGSPLVAACIDTYHERYADVYLSQTSLVEGIAGVLAQLALPLALATAKLSEFVGPLLDAFAIAACFPVVSAAAMSALDEPKAAIVARALAGLGVADAVVIGDTSFDVEAAHANRVRAVGVTWGIGGRAELEAAGADAIVEHPHELLALLRQAG
jgi:phosphoglycolate phosphatase